MSRAVILLKTPSHDSTTDPFVQQISSSGYTPYFIEVLDSLFNNGQQLEAIIRSGPAQYVGVVMTSSRAAEAWEQALRNVAEPGNWAQTYFYVVGETTARALRHITTSYPNQFSESLILGASHSGKSESLAQFILEDLQSRYGGSGGRLLYLTGDKNRDTFHRVMSSGNVDVESLCVYETREAHDLRGKIEVAVQNIKKAGSIAKATWIVFFAPSSSDFALPHLRQYFQLPDTTYFEATPDTRIPAKLAAIGPTTAAYLCSERCFQVDAVALKPNAEQLMAAVRDSDSKDTS